MKRTEVKMTPIQKRIYEVVCEKESVSKEDIAKELGAKPREVTPPIYALINVGAIVKDESNGMLSPSAGVEEEEGAVFISQGEDEEKPNFDDYKPEELVTFYGTEGLDYLKRKSLESALKNVPGVGTKSEACILHIFDADTDIRSEPTEMMNALEDCGIKKALLGRIVREVFLVEKLYGSYLREERNVVIDRRGRHVGRSSSTFIGDARHGGYDDRGIGRGGEEELPYRGREAPADDPPWWYRDLRERLESDAMTGRSQRTQRRFSEDFDAGADVVTPLDKLEKETGALRDEIATLKDSLHEHETTKKIADAMSPLMDRINMLESTRKSGSSISSKGPLSDEQFKAQMEHETVELMTETAERNVERMLGPLIEGQAALQKFQMIQQVIIQERMDHLPAGTLLKYLAPSIEEIPESRVKGTISKLQGRGK